MTKQDIAQIFTIIKSVYANFTSDAEKITVWHALIGDIPFADAKKALYYVLNTSKFEPRPADIRGAISAMQVSDVPTAEQAWGEVLKKANVYANITWSHPLISEAVRIIGLRTICESEVIGVERAHFFKAYDALKAKKSEHKLMQGLGLTSSSDGKLTLEGAGNGQIKH